MVAEKPIIGAMIAKDGKHLHGVFSWRQEPMGDQVLSAICEHLHVDLEAALRCANKLANALNEAAKS